jgi:hypothetical protein
MHRRSDAISGPTIHLHGTDRRVLASALGACLVAHPSTAGLPADEVSDLLAELIAATDHAFDPRRERP